MKIEEAWAFTSWAVDRCLLCGQKPLRYRGVFLPNDPELWPGGPLAPGKIRSFWYGLCKKCAKRKDVPEAVEAVILRDQTHSPDTRH